MVQIAVSCLETQPTHWAKEAEIVSLQERGEREKQQCSCACICESVYCIGF